MKKSFHVFFLFVLFAFFAVNAAWAATLCPESLQKDADTDECYVNMPVTGTSTVNITADDIANGLKTFKVYDDGGKDGNYSEDVNGFLELEAPEGYLLQVMGSVYTYYNFGSLEIYDGNSEAKMLLAASSGGFTGDKAKDIGTISSSGNKLTLNFYASYSGRPGLDLLVSVLSAYSVTIVNVDGGTVTTDKEKATQGELVTLTITPASDYLFDKVEVTYGANNSTVDVSVSENNTSATFTMPAANVTVTPAWKKKHSVTVTEVTGGSVTTDKEKATQGELVTLTITPASDYLFDKVEVTYGENNSAVNVVVSDDKSSATFTMPASDVTVTPSFAKVEHSVTITEVTGGTIETDKTSATQGTAVTLTINPDVDNDYVFKSLEVKDAANNTVYETTSNSTTKTFLMPASDVTVTSSWSKVVHNVTITNVTGGTVTMDNATATYGETVTLAIAPTSGYHINSLAVKDAAENAVDVTLSNDKTKATFTMPKSNVTVKPYWNAELIKDGSGYYVNMPVSGTNTLDLAEYVANGVTSFKVYDDGGKDGNFTSFVNGYLEMTAPAGYQFIIQGSMKTDCGGGSCLKGTFSVFDGNSSATRRVNVYGNVSDINEHSSGNTMTLYFGFGSANSNYDTDSGLDFTVTVFTPHGVNIAGATGGKVTTSKETADEGTAVTLTATPNEGYMLNGISVVDIDGKSVDGTWDIGANTFIFNMPAEAVFVTPLFVPVGDVFVNMPKTGNMQVVISEGMESIKVYDDGGKDGNYSDQSNAILQLVAPENYVFQISGSVTTEVTRDFLEIYDGDKVHDNFLMLRTINNGSVDLNGANILTSSNNVITINFFSNGYTNKSGFDLKVTLVKPTYGAVAIAKADDGKIHATINGDYSENETLSIPEAIEVDAVDYNRELEAGIPVTAMLPVTLPAGTTVNADFYTLEKVEQVEGMKWQATMTYIGKNNLPQPNTPYAVILPEGQTKLEFNLKGNKATVQTSDINKVCGLSDCTLDENGQIKDDWFFTGTYAYKQWNTGDEELGLAYAFAASDNPDGAAKGKFGKIKAGAFANATRCYLRKRDANVKLQQQNQAQQVAASPYVARFSINNLPETIDVEFVKDDEKGGRTVLHGRMNTVTGEFKMLRDFDLKGRKVNSTNRARGAYYGKNVLKK